MITNNTDPQPNASSKPLQNIVNMFEQLTPDNKDMILNIMRQMAESHEPKRSPASELPAVQKDKTPENSFISALYYSINGDSSIYKPLLHSEYSETDREEMKDRLGITDEDARYDFDWISWGFSAEGERHGFEQGLRIGMKLAAFAFQDSDE